MGIFFFPASLLVPSPHSPLLNVICSGAQVCGIIALFLWCAGRDGAKGKTEEKGEEGTGQEDKTNERNRKLDMSVFFPFPLFHLSSRLIANRFTWPRFHFLSRRLSTACLSLLRSPECAASVASLAGQYTTMEIGVRFVCLYAGNGGKRKRQINMGAKERACM